LNKINSSPHLWPIREIQKSLHNSSITLNQILESFLQSVSGSEKTIQAWEIYRDDIDIPVSIKPLSGVFIGIKDNINTIDFPTKMGSNSAWNDKSGGFDARIVNKLRYLGCQIAGKTKTSELAVHLPTSTLNPIYPDSIVGTSSSGSAAAVAAGHVSIALGTQTAGSIARPASFCGVIGFKPSFGDIPRTGVLKTTETFDQVGFFGARVSDLTTIYNMVKVSGKNHPLHESKRNNIDWFKSILILDYSGFQGIDNQLISNYHFVATRIAQKNKLDLELIPISIFEELREAHSVIYANELKMFLGKELSEFQVSNNLKDFLEKFSSNQIKNVTNCKEIIKKVLSHLKLNYSKSIYCALASQSSAPKIGKDEGIDYNFAWTAFGFPQIVLPLLKDGSNKTVGLSISAAQGADLNLLNLAENLMPHSIYENDYSKIINLR